MSGVLVQLRGGPADGLELHFDTEPWIVHEAGAEYRRGDTVLVQPPTMRPVGAVYNFVGPSTHRFADVEQHGSFWTACCTCGEARPGNPSEEAAIRAIVEHMHETPNVTLGSENAQPTRAGNDVEPQ